MSSTTKNNRTQQLSTLEAALSSTEGQIQSLREVLAACNLPPELSNLIADRLDNADTELEEARAALNTVRSSLNQPD